MPTISMADKDFTEWYKNYIAEGQSVSLWEQALTGLQAAYKPQISAVQQSSAYDISQAYANYKKSQLNLLQSQQLGSGLKEQLSSGLGQQYQSAYKQAKLTEAQQLANLAETYAKDVSNVEEQFAQFGETASQLHKALFEYASSGAGEISPSGINYEYQRAFIPENQGGLGFYSLSEDGTYDLTEEGKAFYDKLLGEYTTTYDKTTGARTTTGFGEWLLENKDYADLGKAYAENPALFAEAFGGKTVADLEVSPDENASYRLRDVKASLDKKYIDDTKTFENTQTELDYYSGIANIVDSVTNLNYDSIENTLKTLIAENTNEDISSWSINAWKQPGVPIRIEINGHNWGRFTEKQKKLLRELGFSKGRDIWYISVQDTEDIKNKLVQLYKNVN